MFHLVLIATWVTVSMAIVTVKSPQNVDTSTGIQHESIICPGLLKNCVCVMFKNPTYLYVACNKQLTTDIDFSNFNETITPSKMLLDLQCDPSIILSSTLGDGIFESLHAFFSLEIKVCHSTHISRHAFRGMSSLKDIIIEGGNYITMEKECLQIPDLSNLETVTIVESGLYYAPILCGREQLWLVNITRNNLTTFTDTGLVCDTPTNVVILYISENAITDLPPRMSDVTRSLISFSASNNKIREIAATIFENLTSVLEVDISKNRILTLPADFMGINYNMQSLNFAHNTVELLPMGLFSLAHNITYINLNNMALNDSVWLQLNNMSRLQVLLLNNNNIRLIDKEVLSEMKQLIVLDLSDNDISWISNKLFQSQTELRSLNFTRNNITFIEKDAFMGLHNLFKLDIQQNNIQFIHPEALLEFSDLAILNLSCNIITILPTFPASLQVLDLRENEVRYIDDNVFSRLTNAIGIGLAHNKITDFHPRAFKNSTKLELLQIGYNNISSLDYKMFPRNSSLNSLYVDHNSISNNWAFPTEYFPHLKVLDINNNKLRTILAYSFGQDDVFPESIEELYLAYNEIFYIDNFVFQQPSLRYVDLRENDIQFLSNLALEPSEMNSMPVIYQLSGNPFVCDCNLQWLFNFQNPDSRASIIVQDKNSLFCELMYHHTPSLMKHTSATDYLCKYVDRCISTLCDCCDSVKCNCRTECPKGCTCYRTKNWQDEDVLDCQGANFTAIPKDTSTTCTALYFSGNNLPYVTSEYFNNLSDIWQLDLQSCKIREIESGSFNLLSKLLNLDLSYNLLQSLNGRMFEGLESLGRLSVSFNQIHTIEYGTFKPLKKLIMLDLTSNQLKRLSVYDFEKLSTLISLKLSENPWSCDCSYLKHMKNFTIANAGKIKDIHKVSCLFYNSTLNETLEYPLADVHMPDYCVNQTTFYNEGTNGLDTEAVVVMSTTLSLFTLGIIIFGVLFWNREFLKVWCFVKFGWKWHQHETDDAQRPYDAFVAYSSHDEQFVIRELVPHLEENQNGRPGYRLCVHHRDFAVGALIAESIISAVKHSKRVIIILSENFLHSEWCQFEFQKAYHQLLEEKRNRIIMILLHDINNQVLDNQLKDYLKTRTYVKCGDPWFWEKVNYAMPTIEPPAHTHRNVIPNNHIQLHNFRDEGDIVNDDTELILNDMRNHEEDDPEPVFEMEIQI